MGRVQNGFSARTEFLWWDLIWLQRLRGRHQYLFNNLMPRAYLLGRILSLPLAHTLLREGGYTSS